MEYHPGTLDRSRSGAAKINFYSFFVNDYSIGHKSIAHNLYTGTGRGDPEKSFISRGVADSRIFERILLKFWAGQILKIWQNFFIFTI